jgi:hypothetical protein
MLFSLASVELQGISGRTLATTFNCGCILPWTLVLLQSVTSPRGSQIPSASDLHPIAAASQAYSHEVSMRPYSASSVEKLRGFMARTSFRRYLVTIAITQTDPVKNPKEIARPCLTRTSLRPQVFSTSRRLLLFDTSRAYFSPVALVGFALFRGFSSWVADVISPRQPVRLSLSRLPAPPSDLLVAPTNSSFEKR